MIEFKQIQKALAERMGRMKPSDLFQVGLENKDELWDLYLSCFPEENGIRQSFNCNACKSFICQYGNIVEVNYSDDYQPTSIWDFQIPDKQFQQVLDTLKERVLSKSIISKFDCPRGVVLGTPSNIDHKTGIEWHHFSGSFADLYYPHGKENYTAVFKTSLESITFEAIDTVLELIEADDIYRGVQFKHEVKRFKSLKEGYIQTRNPDNFIWYHAYTRFPDVVQIKNTSIGTLLMDLSEKMDILKAVNRFEAIEHLKKN